MSWVVACALACALACAVVVQACGLYFEPSFEESKKDEKKDDKVPARPAKEQVKEMMTKLHKGDKAPLARTRAELDKDKPDWDQLAKDAKAFGEMSELLKKNREGYRSPEKYISSVAALAKAAQDKDHKAAATAFAGLSQSCVSCHFYGAPGK
jgi:hypothetical protein